jgi:uncharacterized protein (TIGR00106 family)
MLVTMSDRTLVRASHGRMTRANATCSRNARPPGAADRIRQRPRGGPPGTSCSLRSMLIAFSITPLGTGEGVGEIVAEAVRVVRASGLPNRTDSMFTTIEGNWDEVMAVVKEAVDAVAARAPRVSLMLKADIRPSVTDGLTSKVETIERYLES